VDKWIELIKAAVRPFIIAWGCVTYTLCLANGAEPPELLVWLVTAVIAEYFGERAIKRLKEGNTDTEKLVAEVIKQIEAKK
jgi:hypothetical protein